MKPKILNIISLLISVIIIINELMWVSRSKVAIIILFLAIAVGLNSLSNLLNNIKNKKF